MTSKIALCPRLNIILSLAVLLVGPTRFLMGFPLELPEPLFPEARQALLIAANSENLLAQKDTQSSTEWKSKNSNQARIDPRPGVARLAG